MDPVAQALERWQRLVPGAVEIGRAVVQAYADPRRRYHDVAHLLAVLRCIDLLAAHAADPRLVSLAGFFHDVVYDVHRTDNEERSAQRAERDLAAVGVRPLEGAEVARLVRVTAGHNPAPGDLDGAVLCDADLAVLAGNETDYAAYVRAVRAEYSFADDDQWRTGRAAVLDQLLRQHQLFRTPRGLERWEAAARTNLEVELAELRPPR